MKNGPAYSHEEKIAIIREHEEGHKTLKQVCEKYGISKSYLCYLLKRYREEGEKRIADTRYYSAEFKLQVVKRHYEDAVPIMDLVRETGIQHRVINLLLAHPDFAALSNRIADYLDDRMAAGIAAQNQLYDSVSELMMRIGKEDKVLRQAATTQAREAKSLRRKLYADELAQIEALFKSILSSIKKESPTGKPEAAKAMTKQGFDQMLSELTKGGSVAEILKVQPEQITALLAESFAAMDGVTEEMKADLSRTLLPFFKK